MKPPSSAGRRLLPCTATVSEPHSSATSQASIGRSPSSIGLIRISGSCTPPLWLPADPLTVREVTRPSGGQVASMTVLRALARPMLATIFIVEGYSALREPGRLAPAAEPVVRRLADRVPAVPAKTEQAVRLN